MQPSAPVVVGLFAHPDDESYAAAGALIKLRQAGAHVTMVCATRGEAATAHRAPHHQIDPKALAKLRTREMEEACHVIGARDLHWLDFPDGELEKIPTNELFQLDRCLRPLRADSVITLGLDGAYGHRDHQALTRAATVVLSHHPSTQLWLAQFPKHLLSRVQKNLAAIWPEKISYETVGIAKKHAHCHLDISEVSHLKAAAVAAHRSQLVCNNPATLFGSAAWRFMLTHEWYTRTFVDRPPKRLLDGRRFEP